MVTVFLSSQFSSSIFARRLSTSSIFVPSADGPEVGTCRWPMPADTCGEDDGEGRVEAEDEDEDRGRRGDAEAD